ncbi:hypothetical protein EMCRGX_G019398 [Ephydatia muelleri]
MRLTQNSCSSKKNIHVYNPRPAALFSKGRAQDPILQPSCTTLETKADEEETQNPKVMHVTKRQLAEPQQCDLTVWYMYLYEFRVCSVFVTDPLNCDELACTRLTISGRRPGRSALTLGCSVGGARRHASQLALLMYWQ